MLRVSPFLSAGDATPETSRALLHERPAVARYLAEMSRSNKSRARACLLAAGYSAESVNVLLPKVSPAPRAEPAGSSWDVVPGRVRLAIADALDRDAEALSVDPADWDADAIGSAARAVAALPVSPARVAGHLDRLRVALRLILGAEYDARTQILAARAAVPTPAADAPAELPEPYRVAEHLRARLAAYVADDTNQPTAQIAADLCATLASREANALTMGERGGLSRYIAEKLAGVDADGSPVYPLAAVVGVKLVRDSFTKWRSATPRQRLAALKALPELLAGWGVTRPQLAAVGLALASEAAPVV